MTSDSRQTPIAIVGMSSLFPGSSDLAGFFRDVLEGRDRLVRVPADRWLVEDYYDPDPAAPDKIYVDRGGFLDAVDFDPMRWGVPPSIVPATDSTQLLALVVAERVLRDAFGDTELPRDATSVILGVTGAQKLLGEMNSRLQRPVWVKALREMGLPEDQVQAACDKIAASYPTWQESTFPGVLGNVVAGRIANRLDLGGTNCVTDAACASAFSALKMAVDELSLGHSDVVVCGGADTMNDPFMFECFAKTTALSKTGDCRPFSDRADGTMLGEGVGMVVLMRLEDAEARGLGIYAVIRGVGSSSDGRAKSVYAPLPSGQAKALRRAYARAGYGADTVELVEAHGTGTAAGDAAELEALAAVFSESGRTDARWCAVGSVKSQIGHTKAAAGAAGLIKTALAVRHGVLPPTIKIERPSPAVDWAGGPFYANVEARPWIRGGDHPRRASVSSFGFGGANFHVTLEEYRGEHRAPRVPMGGAELVVLSAADAAGLAARVREITQELDGDDGVAASERGLRPPSPQPPPASGRGSSRRIAFASQRVFDASAGARLALVVKDDEDLRGKLALALPFVERGEAFSAPGGVELAFGAPDHGELAFLFPGQGSQYLGMGAPLAMRFERARAAWDRAAHVGRVVFPAPTFDEDERAAQEATLRATENAQPALGVASVAALEVLRALGVSPAMVGGHSFGEAVALFAAGSLGEAELVRVAEKRGALMADASSGAAGAMLAVSAEIERVRALVEGAGLAVSVANHNHPTQVVLSGARDAIEAAERVLRDERVRSTRLDVATAFHSPIVSGSTEPFLAFLREVTFSTPQVPVYANATAAPYAGDVRATLARQIAEPVRFVEQIEAMYAAGARTFVEVGAGSVLTGLVGRILKGRAHRAVALDRKDARDLGAFYGGLAKLAAAGVALRFDALWEGERLPDAPAQNAPRMTLKVTGANYGKAYPPPGGAAALPPPNATADGALPRAATETRNDAVAADQMTKKTKIVPDAAAADQMTKKTKIVPDAAVPGAASERDDAALAAFVEMQRQTAEAHAVYQRAMADAHTAFLRGAESAMTALAALGASPSRSREGVGGRAAEGRDQTADSPDLTALMLEVVAEKTGYPREMLDPSMELEADLGVDSIKRVEILSALRERAADLPELDPAALGKLRTLAEIAETLSPSRSREGAGGRAAAGRGEDADSSPDLTALMLEVVAEKTGYPQEMLDPSMGLEADLGVDSIKRVEILSALRERAPDLPELDPAKLGKLRTLAEIAEVLGASTSSPPPSAALRPAPSRKREGEIGRFVVELSEVAAPGLAPSGLFGADVVVIDGESGLGEPVVDALERRGVRARVADAAPADATAVVALHGLGPDGRAAARGAFDVARAIAPRFTEHGGLFVTVQDTGGALGAHRPWHAALTGLAKTAALEWPEAVVRAIDVAGDDVPDRVADELVSGGLAREVALGPDGKRRVPRVVPGTIDADSDGTAHTDGARAESHADGASPGSHATHADGASADSHAAPVDGASAASHAAPVDGASADSDATPVVVASGGARGVTAACLVALARERGGRYLLLGRTPLADEPDPTRGVADADLERALLADATARGERVTPKDLRARAAAVRGGREIRATIDAIHDAGGVAVYESTDVRDAAALGAILERFRAAHGAITTLAHGAGVLADRLLVDKTHEDFERVFATKVDGLRALLDATRDDAPALVLFSSVAARWGNPGQSDYAMANAVLDAVAAHEQAQGRRAVSIAWGPWAGGMVTPELAAHFASRGVSLIDVDDGAAAFVREVVGGAASRVVIGAPLGAGRADGEHRFDVVFSRATHPYLADHSVEDVPVLPVVLVLDAFARAAASLRPDLSLVRCRELAVLRGVRLARFDEGERFEVALTLVSNGASATYRAELRSGAAVRYRAEVDLHPERPPAPIARPAPALSERSDPLYGGCLFHGERFQVIRALDGVGDDGAAGTLVGTRAVGWGGDGWALDPALLDGGLQLAVLWTERRLGGWALPTALGALSVVEPGPIDGEVRAIVHGREARSGRAVCDVTFVDASGRVVAALSSVETHVRPGAVAADLRPR